MKIEKIIENIVRKVGELPPEPLPEAEEIARDHLPPIVKELVSSDGRFVIIISVNKNIFRAHSFQWLTHADDDVWNAFWGRRGDVGKFCKLLPEVDKLCKSFITYQRPVRSSLHSISTMRST